MQPLDKAVGLRPSEPGGEVLRLIAGRGREDGDLVAQRHERQHPSLGGGARTMRAAAKS